MSSAPGTHGPLPATGCQGLDEGTFVAVLWQGKGQAQLIGGSPAKLSAADLKTLQGITPWRAPNPADWSSGEHHPPPHTAYLNEAGGTYLLTALSDPDGDAPSTSPACRCAACTTRCTTSRWPRRRSSARCCCWPACSAPLWVRLSLRPLRRVAATASQVAELPLESGEVELPAGVPDTDPRTETGQVGSAFNRMLGHVQTALRAARGQRDAAAPVRRRRAPRAAHPAGRHPRLRRAGAAPPGDSPEAVTHALSRVLSESTRMTVLVDDLLLLARLDAGRPLSREPVDMTRLAIDATSDARVARPGHRWMLELPDDPVLALGDEHRLHQVLVNLLSNAGRHTPDGTSVTVRVSDDAAGRRARQRPGVGQPGHAPAGARGWC